MFSKLRIKPNPKLEAIRKEGLQAPPVEYDINQLIEKSNIIHAGWLFDFNHRLLLQKLLRLLDGNTDTINTPGWGSFGNQLGISNEILKVIQCSKLGDEGYTYYVLQHYIQKNDATIQKIIQALMDIERLDVIHQTQSYFNSLVENVLQNQEYPDEGDSGISISSLSSDLIRPSFIPTPAFVLRELEEHVQLASTDSITSTSHGLPRIENESIQTSDNTRNPRDRDIQELPRNKQNVIPKYDCKVLLTFAADGISYATTVAKAFRSKREDGLNIGVLILNEHEKLVSSNPELFIGGSFPQVDYVVPIITEGYLLAAMDTKSPTHTESLYLDCRYVRFIYTLMYKNYVRSGCLNKKIRCIIPDELTHLTRKTLMKEPIFETWVKSSSVDKLAARMLRRCVRKRNN